LRSGKLMSTVCGKTETFRRSDAEGKIRGRGAASDGCLTPEMTGTTGVSHGHNRRGAGKGPGNLLVYNCHRRGEPRSPPFPYFAVGDGNGSQGVWHTPLSRTSRNQSGKIKGNGTRQRPDLNGLTLIRQMNIIRVNPLHPRESAFYCRSGLLIYCEDSSRKRQKVSLKFPNP